jgi:hypothetical protein
VAVIRSNYATTEDIARLEAQMAKMEARIIKWMVGVVGAGTIAVFGAALSLAKVLTG